MKQAAVIVFLLCNYPAFTQNKDEKEILGILDRQAEAWNQGDIEAYMVGYWPNDSLMYIGKNGISYGYENTLQSYKKNYGDTARMGKLALRVVQLKKLSGEYYSMAGQWYLKRSVGDAGGYFTLLFRKIRGKWYIISDHSS